MPDPRPSALSPATLDGEAHLTVGGSALVARSGETVLLPAGVPHGVNARTRFKILLTMIRS